MSTVRIGFAKIGNIGSAPLLEFLLDERADREDVEVTVVSSGAKMSPADAERVARLIVGYAPSFVVTTSPNASLPGPARLRELVAKAGIPLVVVSDAPARKITRELEDAGLGYIIVLADAMIGARREFLDPVEMSLFNADLFKVLATTGVFSIFQVELDRLIEASKKGEKPALPRLIVDKESSVAAARFTNPYAKAKAMAAYEMARRVADLTTEGCFVVKEWERYTPIVASAHEMMRAAATLADEARELEKAGDTVYRAPHHRDGAILQKRKLIEKPQRSP
ncbi:MAG: F420-dependent methylenetetrahydromethanopterin dehydrogenase [Candidatus Bathyarchaeia archaeon]